MTFRTRVGRSTTELQELGHITIVSSNVTNVRDILNEIWG